MSVGSSELNAGRSAPRGAVFLSYASQDSEAAKRIADALRAAGVEVWFDQSELRGGDAWDAKIRKQIAGCALFVPVISASTQARLEGYFRLEWKLAAQRTMTMADERAFLLPVVIDDTKNAVAKVPPEFKAVQWTHLPDGGASPAFAARVKTLLDDGAFDAPQDSPVRERSVAVLAFANLSHDPENEYFSDGISEELLNLLAKIPGLRVTARTSAFFFKGKNVPVPEIGRKLGVAHLVEGSVRRAGGRVRITAQLIEAAGGFHLWSETYDRELQDIFALQDEVARDIAKNFQLKVGLPSGRGTVNPEVHELVLQGRHGWNQFTEAGFVQAEQAFGKALAIEPECAPAAAGFALVGCRRAILRGLASQHQASALAETERFARQALQFDATLAEPQAVLGAVALMRGQLAESERAFRQARLINPNSDLALVYHARLHQRLGRPDLARPEIEEAQRLSPLTFTYTGHLALALLAARRPAAVIEAVNLAEGMGAGSSWARSVGAVALLRAGRLAEAAAMARTALQTGPVAEALRGHIGLTEGMAAWALAAAGEPAEAENVVQRLRQGPVQCHYAAGFAMTALGDRGAGLALLEDIPQFMVDHVLIFADQNEAVQADPGFHRLLHVLDAREAFETHQHVLHRMEAGQ